MIKLYETSSSFYFTSFRKSSYKSNDNNNLLINNNSSFSNAGDAQKRFANAKAISSDQYFGSSNSEVRKIIFIFPHYIFFELFKIKLYYLNTTILLTKVLMK